MRFSSIIRKILHVNLIELYVRQCEQSVELELKTLFCKSRN